MRPYSQNVKRFWVNIQKYFYTKITNTKSSIYLFILNEFSDFQI